jgi:regulator of replication initiation timing
MMEELRKRNDMLQIENDKFHDKLNEMRLHFEAESNQTKYDSD